MRCRHMRTNTFAKGLSLDCLTNPCGDCILPQPERNACPKCGLTVITVNCGNCTSDTALRKP